MNNVTILLLVFGIFKELKNFCFVVNFWVQRKDWIPNMFIDLNFIETSWVMKVILNLILQKQ